MTWAELGVFANFVSWKIPFIRSERAGFFTLSSFTSPSSFFHHLFKACEISFYRIPIYDGPLRLFFYGFRVR